jgi:hypothetical protein
VKTDLSSLNYIDSLDDLHSKIDQPMDAFLIRLSTASDAIRAVVRIRSEYPYPYYLLPVIWINESSDKYPDKLAIYFDSIWNQVNYASLQRLIAKRNEQMERFHGDESNVWDIFELRLLRLLALADGIISPFCHRNSPFGFHFSILCTLIDYNQIAWAIQQCERMVVKDWMSSTLSDIAYLCPSCADGFIHYIDHCPKCGAVQLESQDLIHHFVCGHTGPLSDFYKPAHLECPKCNRQLKHIGVDYDKPSFIYECQVCAHHFQQPSVKVHCRNCADITDPMLLQRMNINQYFLTPAGRQIAISGLMPSKSVAPQNGTVSLEMYRFIFRNEQLRENVGQLGCVARVELARKSKSSTFEQSLLTELVSNILALLKPSDVICQTEENCFEIFSPQSTVIEMTELLNQWKKSVTASVMGLKQEEVMLKVNVDSLFLK